MFDKHKPSKVSEPRMVEPELTPRTSAPPAPPFAAAGKAAVIGPGIIIDGDISGSENLVIEGKVRGRVQLASHEVTVGPTGEVSADITAKLIRIAGKVKGDLSGKEKVIIVSTGNVHGNVVAPRVLLEDGAVFKGSIDMDPREPAAQPSAQPAARAAAPASTAASAAVKPGAPSEQNAASSASGKAPDLALKSG